MRFKRRLKLWGVVVSWAITAAFVVGDASAWVGYLLGYQLPEAWVRIGAFILFGATVLLQLDKREARIEQLQDKTRLKAIPAKMALNYPPASEPPLTPDEVSIDITVQFEVWTDVDIHTSSLILNVVGVRTASWRRFWAVALRKSKRLIGIRMVGHDTSTYRRQINCANEQPFTDQATFKWRGKRTTVEWGDDFVFELALEAGSPKGVWRALLDHKLYSRGATSPL